MEGLCVKVSFWVSHRYQQLPLLRNQGRTLTTRWWAGISDSCQNSRNAACTSCSRTSAGHFQVERCQRGTFRWSDVSGALSGGAADISGALSGGAADISGELSGGATSAGHFQVERRNCTMLLSGDDTEATEQSWDAACYQKFLSSPLPTIGSPIQLDRAPEMLRWALRQESFIFQVAGTWMKPLPLTLAPASRALAFEAAGSQTCVQWR